MNFYFTVEFRRCVGLFSASMGLRTWQSLRFNSKLKYEKSAFTVHVLQNTLNLAISHCAFAEDSKKCTTNYNGGAQLLFYSLNLLICGVLDQRCRRSLLKVPILFCKSLSSFRAIKRRNSMCLCEHSTICSFLQIKSTATSCNPLFSIYSVTAIELCTGLRDTISGSLQFKRLPSAR